MCLITEQLTPLIAEEAIHVYKGLNHGRKAVMHNFHYNKNELYKTEIMEEDQEYTWSAFDDVDGGYLEQKYGENFRFIKPKELKCLAQGFHSANTPQRIGFFADKVYKATIPKGSEYYKDTTGLFVSNQIIVH